MKSSFILLLPLCLIPLVGCSSITQASSEVRPFYQKEIGTETHGKKTLFDRVVEVDPGGLNVEMAPDYDQHAPAVIAPMPFTDHGSAQYTVDKVPLSFRNQKERQEWAWTDAQRLRRAFVGYLSGREFTVINPIAVDAVLKAHGINNEEDLQKVSPLTLGKWFNADAVLYGQVNHYEAFYFALVSGYEVGVSSRMVSTHDGETLMRTDGARFAVDVMPAMTMEDILINSAEALLKLRDVELARAEDEVARELVLRIPPSDKLRTEMAKNAIQKANEAEPVDLEANAADPQMNVQVDAMQQDVTPPAYQSVVFSDQDTDKNADDDADSTSNKPATLRPVDQQTHHLKTAASWQPARRDTHLASFSTR